jgi:Bacterial Ig domain
MRPILLVCLAPAVASAAPVVIDDIDGVGFARQILPATGTTTAQSTIIYLNHTGASLRPGVNDSRTQHSSLVPQQVAIPAWSTSAANWNATVDCFKEVWSRFGVTVVDSDPGNVPHIEAIFGGSPTLLGMPSNVGGVSPFTLDCGIVENSIVFTFVAAMPNITPRQACEIMSQEVAHSYGLDHELLASDPMTYLPYSGKREFQDQSASCGESTPRPCGLTGASCRATQNSVQLLIARVGSSSGDQVAPTVDFASPDNGDTVSQGFEVDATASDNVAVTEATLSIDGSPVASIDGAGPFVFTTDASLAPGVHAIEIAVSDGHNTQSETHTVMVEHELGLDDLAGGCSAGGGGIATGFALLGLVGRRRRS